MVKNRNFGHKSKFSDLFRNYKCNLNFKLKKYFLDKNITARLATTIEEIEILDHLEKSLFNKLLSRDRYLHGPNLNPAIIFKMLLLRPGKRLEHLFFLSP